MLQLFAEKQVFNVSAVLTNLSKQKDHAHAPAAPPRGRPANTFSRVKKKGEWKA
jgi:hypothetical protein